MLVDVRWMLVDVPSLAQCGMSFERGHHSPCTSIFMSVGCSGMRAPKDANIGSDSAGDSTALEPSAQLASLRTSLEWPLGLMTALAEARSRRTCFFAGSESTPYPSLSAAASRSPVLTSLLRLCTAIVLASLTTRLSHSLVHVWMTSTASLLMAIGGSSLNVSLRTCLIPAAGSRVSGTGGDDTIWMCRRSNLQRRGGAACTLLPP
mmetsp:Transcript_26478/g.58034  ORF Transcript_26478/g.58034 Transcript_26478/m.58034 type:complete len:206 (+) Transcript_26478:261-878(+)